MIWALCIIVGVVVIAFLTKLRLSGSIYRYGDCYYARSSDRNAYGYYLWIPVNQVISGVWVTSSRPPFYLDAMGFEKV